MTIGLLAALGGCGTTSGVNGDFAGSIDIGNGRQLYLECHGKGSPTVILESGYHNSSDPWSHSDAAAPAVGPAVLPALAGNHRVCAYDRPGTLRYPDPPSYQRPQFTGADATYRARRRRRSARVTRRRTSSRPLHSGGALAGRAVCPAVRPDLPRRSSRSGVRRRLRCRDPEPVGIRLAHLSAALDEPLPQFADSSSFEVIDIDKSVAQVAAAPPFPPIPTVVLSRTEPFVIPADRPAGAGRETRTGMAAGHVGPHCAAAANAARRRDRQRSLRPDPPTRSGGGRRRSGDAEVCPEALRRPTGIISQMAAAALAGNEQ